ncbi:MAG: NUDIX domain-containing protein [Bacteroidia bacterium]
MPQKYAVYLNRKAIFFNNPQGIQPQAQELISIEGKTDATVLKALKHVDNSLNDSASVFLPDLSLQEGLDILAKQVKLLEAAGGLVKNSEGKYLFIFRLGMWDLPKGKAEKGEKPDLTASREIIEETGVRVGMPDSFLCNTFHMYPLRGKMILKKTYWFSFSTSDCNQPVPQTEEDISKAVWLDWAEASKAAEVSYPSIQDVWAASGQLPVT